MENLNRILHKEKINMREKEKRMLETLPPPTQAQTLPLPEPPRPAAQVVRATKDTLWSLVEFDVLGVTKIYGFQSEREALTALNALPTKFSAQANLLMGAGITPARQGEGYIIPTHSIYVAMGEYFGYCAEHPQSLTKLASDKISFVENMAREAVSRYTTETAHITRYLEEIAATGRFIQPPGRNHVIDSQTQKIVIASGIASANPGVKNIEELCLFPDLTVLLAVKRQFPETVPMARILAAHLFGDVKIPDTAGVRLLEPGVPFRLIAWGGEERLVTAKDLIEL